MKFVVNRASNGELGEIREFSTIKHLIDFMKAVGYDLIISDNFFYESEYEVPSQYCEPEYSITIYDDYIE